MHILTFPNLLGIQSVQQGVFGPEKPLILIGYAQHADELQTLIFTFFRPSHPVPADPDVFLGQIEIELFTQIADILQIPFLALAVKQQGVLTLSARC